MSDKKLVLGIARRRWPTLAQLRYLNNLLSFRERLLVGIATTGFIVSALSLGIVYYYASTTAQPTQGGTYTEGVVGQPQYINPILAQANDVDLDLSRLLFSRLFSRTGNQTLQPDLVSDYSISEDQLTYTFYLRRNVKWHDGEPLTVDDVLFTIQAIQDPNYHSPLEPSLRGVTTHRIDDYTFTITLDEPFAPFLSSLTFGILPEHIWFDAYKVSLQNITLSEYNIKPIGSGPFMFDTLVKDTAGVMKSYSVVPFADYYDHIPYLERITFVFYPDIYSATEDLRRSTIDGVAFLDRATQENVRDKKRGLQYYHLQLPQYTAIFFNQEHSDILSNDTVRQALVWGVDRDRIITEVLGGEGEPIYSPILPGYLGYNTELEHYGFDLAAGQQILEEAGWKLDVESGIRSKGDELLEFTIATVNQPEFVAALDILQSNWTSMGVKVNVNVYEAADIQEQIIKPRNYEALLFGEIIGVDPDPYAFWHSTQMEHPGLALAVFYQKNIDNLLETARKTSDAEQRRLKYFNFQNILAEELPAIFLYNPYYSYAMSKDIHGVDHQVVTNPADRFSNITYWYRDTIRVKSTS
ncbi:MAG: hypothetical protein HYV33_04940 [Candidatus Kerfeldbacteria bacterium]|nr:hypothetical protein [Candidatus Kerfeldbacteria bacterium]